MEKIVKDFLEVRQLGHLWSKAKFNSYLRKIGNNGNRYLTALNIADMFILNG